MAACNSLQTSSFRKCVLHPARVNVFPVIVDPCGVWNVWGSGLQVDRISIVQMFGCLVPHPAQHVDQDFVCWMCVWLLCDIETII